MNGFPWGVLGIEKTRDQQAIRRAYADRLRELDIDNDIAGFSQLRSARDTALWEAQHDEQEDDYDFGLGSLDDEDETDVSIVRTRFEGDGGFDPGGEAFGGAFEQTDSAAIGLGEYGDGDLDFDITPAEKTAGQEAWEELVAILFPDGEYSDEAITIEEHERGSEQLAILTDHAAHADIVEHNTIDHQLGELFASTWPRSSPFVEQANQEFHWLDEAGKLEERPALVFLNARIKGMRFHEKVQQPDHPLHKAWVELSRPGRANFIDKFRGKRAEIHTLLGGIRERYPELESLLDPQRVASWEGETADSTGPTIVQWMAIVFIGFSLLRFCSNQDRPSVDALPVPPEANISLDTRPPEEKIAEVFGEEYDNAAVLQADPIFADQLRNELDRYARFGAPIQPFVRNKALQAREIAGFEELVAIAELQAIWLRAARAEGSDTCAKVMRGDFSGELFTTASFELSGEDARKEREAFARLLEAGILSHRASGGDTTFSVPGWLVEQTINRSGLTDQAVSAALRDPEDRNRCAVSIALLEAIIEQPGRAPVELLRKY